MDPLILGALVGTSTILILFSGISVGIGLLVVSALFIMIFDGAPSLPLCRKFFFANLTTFPLYFPL